MGDGKSQGGSRMLGNGNVAFEAIVAAGARLSARTTVCHLTTAL